MFAQNWLSCTLRKVKYRNFRKFALFFVEKLEKLRFQVKNLGNYGEIWGILVQKYQRGEAIFFVPLKLGTRVGHEKLNFAIFEFYDFAKKNRRKIRLNF